MAIVGRRYAAFIALVAALVCGLAAERAAANPFVDQGGTVVADSGFRPETHGYSFENYTNDGKPTNLTPAEMVGIYGPGVCAGPISASGQCVLTAKAKLLMARWNNDMGGGHCYGMAATAHFFYYGIGDPPPVFGSNVVPGIPFNGNSNIQRQIAFGFVFQFFQATPVTKGTPNEVLSAVVDALNQGAPVVIGFYKADKTGGHAVTPIFVVDRGNGVVDMVVYDNNFPNQYRTIVVDTNTNTWDYLGGTDPSNASQRYVGNAQTRTVELHYLQPAVQSLPLPGFRRLTGAQRGEATELPTTVAVSSEAEGAGPEFTVKTGAGDASWGFDENGEATFENGIEGSEARFPLFDAVEVWEQKAPPELTLPDAPGETRVNLRADDIKGSPDQDVSLVRDGVSFEVQSIEVKDGERQNIRIEDDELVFDNEEGEDEGIKVRFGFSAEEDYLFTVGVRSLEEDARVALDIVNRNDDLQLETRGDRGQYSLEVQKTDGNRTVELTDEKIKSKKGKELVVDFDNWKKGDDSAPIER